MSFTEIIEIIGLPFLGCLLALNAISSKSGFHRKEIIDFIIGIFIMAFAIWAGINNLQISKNAKATQDSLIVSQHRVEAIQKDIQILELKLNLNQKTLGDSISYLAILNKDLKTILKILGLNDSLRGSLLTLKFENLRKAYDSLKAKETEPLLDIMQDSYPVLVKEYKGFSDVLLCIIKEVTPNFVATNLKCKLVIVNENGNEIGFYSTNPISFIGDNLHYEKGLALPFQLNLKFFSPIRKRYGCLKVNYTDKEGVSQKPLIMLFNITPEYDKRFPPIYGDDYEKIVKYLISKKAI